MVTFENGENYLFNSKFQIMPNIRMKKHYLHSTTVIALPSCTIYWHAT